MPCRSPGPCWRSCIGLDLRKPQRDCDQEVHAEPQVFRSWRVVRRGMDFTVPGHAVEDMRHELAEPHVPVKVHAQAHHSETGLCGAGDVGDIEDLASQPAGVAQPVVGQSPADVAFAQRISDVRAERER